MHLAGSTGSTCYTLVYGCTAIVASSTIGECEKVVQSAEKKSDITAVI